MNDENQEKKEIEVITGDGSELDISTVYDHIKPDNPKLDDDKKKNIIIPEGDSSKDNNN